MAKNPGKGGSRSNGPSTPGARLAGGAVAALLALVLLVAVGAVLWQFVNAFFIALAGYVFLKPVYSFLRARGLGKVPSGCATLAIGALLIGIPCVFALKLMAGEAASLYSQAQLSGQIDQLGKAVGNISTAVPQLGSPDQLSADFTKTAMATALYAQSLVFGWVQGMGKVALDLLIAVFTLYYLLVSEEKLGKIRNYLPFSAKNTDLMVSESKKVLYSSVLVTGLMAVIQAVPLTLVFIYFNVPGAVFLGIIAALLTCVPFTGIPVVWIPVAIIEALSGNTGAALGITAVGLVIAVIENFRPMLQNRIGKIHPLVSLLGVIVGVPYFGILGFLIGPILLSLALLSARMFKEEYL